MWIEHLRRPLAKLNDLLSSDRIVGHSFVTGDVSPGSLRERGRMISRLSELPQLRVAVIDHVAALIERQRLWSTGIGYADAHVLASLRLSQGSSL